MQIRGPEPTRALHKKTALLRVRVSKTYLDRAHNIMYILSIGTGV